MSKEYYYTEKSQIGNLSEIYLDYFGYKTNGYFVEVGGYDGTQYSNTYGLAKVWWHGLIFEPQPYIFDTCVKNYKNYPNIKIEKCCIGSYDGNIDLYIGGPLTTTSKEMVEVYKTLDFSKGLFIGDIYPVKSTIYKLDNMLEKYNWPISFDVLVIDTEGTELEVLTGFSIDKWLPRLVIIEMDIKNKNEFIRIKSEKINEIMKENKYKKIHEDSINSIFVLN